MRVRAQNEGVRFHDCADEEDLPREIIDVGEVQRDASDLLRSDHRRTTVGVAEPMKNGIGPELAAKFASTIIYFPLDQNTI